jgi:hypothetical protein
MLVREAQREFHMSGRPPPSPPDIEQLHVDLADSLEKCKSLISECREKLASPRPDRRPK